MAQIGSIRIWVYHYLCMNRRRFLNFGCLVGLGPIQHMGLLTGITAGLAYSAGRSLLESDVLFQQLARFESFREIDKILLSSSRRPYFLVATQPFAQMFGLHETEHSQITLGSINSVCGRFSNFSSEFGVPDSAYIITQGEAGRTLSETTNLKVISKFSPAIHSKKYFTDAFPHHFNSIENDRTKWFREYWLDSVTRKSIDLTLHLTFAISDSEKKDVDILASDLQRRLYGIEAAALEKIKNRFEVKNFDPIFRAALKDSAKIQV